MGKIVQPKQLEGYNLSWNFNLFSSPNFTITCGACGFTFKQRPPLIDHPTVECPHCRTLNKLPLIVEKMED